MGWVNLKNELGAIKSVFRCAMSPDDQIDGKTKYMGQVFGLAILSKLVAKKFYINLYKENSSINEISYILNNWVKMLHFI